MCGVKGFIVGGDLMEAEGLSRERQIQVCP